MVSPLPEPVEVHADDNSPTAEPAPDARTRLLADYTGAPRLNMERSGSLEGILDTRQPGGREDSPGALPGELLGQARSTVEPPLLVTSTEEALEFLPSELLGVAGAPRAMFDIEACRASRCP